MATSAAARASRLPTWLAALVPLAVIAALIALFLAFNPIGSLREVPPVEALAVERTVFTEDAIELQLRNDGPDEVSIAQVQVNESYWAFEMDDRSVGRLETTEMTIPYPWDEGLPVRIAIVTSTGVVIDHEVEAAALTPEADASTLGVYALLGIYIGVVPIAVGLLWFSALRRVSRKWLDFFLAFTVGLLVFLLVDTVAEGLELSGEAPASLDALSLFAIGALVAVAGLVALQGFLKKRGASTRTAAGGALALAYLIAAGIGLHNLGEGLAVGAALAVGEVALGTFLVLGFALHNTTEGIAIIAPLGSAQKRPAWKHFVGFGAVAGLPTVAGAWLGGFAFSPAWGALAFGVAAGAIAQVVWQIAASMGRDRSFASASNAVGFIVGLVFMYATGLLTA
ncbi:MAG: ZIP family metal transporter [Actinomycetota bacterium]|nr:ZIP family metal transporter [Actinomycetota bacterium]